MFHIYLNRLILHCGDFPGSSDEFSSNIYKSFYDTTDIFLALYSLGDCRCLEVNIFEITSLFPIVVFIIPNPSFKRKLF